MTKEKEEKPSSVTEIPCAWCGMVDERKKVYSSPGDDLENPEAYHEKCFEALRFFMILLVTEGEKNPDKLVKMANQLAGVEIKRRKTKK